MLIDGRYIVIRRRHGLLRPEDGQAALLQAGESLRAGHLMDQMTIDV